MDVDLFAMRNTKVSDIDWWRIAGLGLLVSSWWISATAQVNCTGDSSVVGSCDSAYNFQSCGYDGGDCCICTCINNIECHFGIFDCLDPDIGDELYECEAPPPPPLPCSQGIQQSWVVNSSVQAEALAEAVNCSGGTFDVEWHGNVVVERTIHVADLTSLNITGARTSAPAGIDGGSERRLFTVVNALLHLENLRISSGSAVVGGAIAATKSVLTLKGTTFVGNKARSFGGAVFVTDGSSVMFGGEESAFINNEAIGDGGAFYVSDSSVVTWTTEVNRFVNNTAGEDGGAIAILGSSGVSLDGYANFTGNSCSRSGGALYVAAGSHVSWSQDALFSKNICYDNDANGGAVTLRINSTASWSGKTTFAANSANFSGGALYATDSSLIFWSGETTFTRNIASFGGALFGSYSSIIKWSGYITFTGNSAVYSGGALMVTLSSIISWSGDTAFISNVAGHTKSYFADDSSEVSLSGQTISTSSSSKIYRSFGGAVSVILDSIMLCNSSTTFSSNAADFGGAVDVYARSIVVLDGSTTFENNHAEESGGAMFADDSSSISWLGETTFSGNTASRSGGALFVSFSWVSWWGETTFSGNVAHDLGGAVSAWHSDVSWGGATSFLNNSADEGGGRALKAFLSKVEWSGKTNFSNNQAHGGGGALDSGGSSLWWEAETKFTSNIGALAGGGIYIYNSSTVSWNAETYFLNNSADNGGGIAVRSNSSVSWSGARTLFSLNKASTFAGALFAEDCHLSWNGFTLFLNNSADLYGGALFIFNDTKAAWGGNTTFSGNAAAYGGGLYLFQNPSVRMSGQNEFSHNYAQSDGGAVVTYAMGISSVELSNFSIAGPTTFANNTCGENGGALASFGADVEFESANVSFVGNSAQVAGGAVFLTGADVGPTFPGLSFVSNSAQLGGAVYATSSGNGKVSRTGKQQSNPVRFIECSFVHNVAEAMGGAIHTAAGQEVIVNTYFVGNKAGTGGASRLAGTASLDNCSFEDNISDEAGGAAVSNIGYISNMKNILFRGNVYDCKPGTFLNFNVSEDIYLYKVICDGCETTCQGCYFGESLVPLCTTVMDHSTSPGGSTTLEMIFIDLGYWRATASSVEVMPCYNFDACLGGVTGASGFCRNGFEGPYCAVCSDGYSASIGFSCEKCSNSTGGIVLAIFLAAAAVVVVVVVARYLVSTEQDSPETNLVERMTRFIPLQSLKIVIVVWQILTQFADVAKVTYPNVYERFLDGVNVLNFDLAWVPSVGCVLELDFHRRLLFASIGPILVVVLIATTYGVAVCRNRGSDETLRNARQKHVSVFLLFTFLVYSSVSSILFQTFACEPLDDGMYYVRADYRVECDSPRHEAFKIYAAFMTVLYTVGIPALYGFLLFKERGVLRLNEPAREDIPRICSTSQLWKPYKPSVFYYEVIECSRRILLTGVLVFIYPNTPTQIAVTLILAFIFAMVSEALNPYVSRWDTWISRVGHIVVFLSVFLALLLKVNVSAERSESQEMFEVFLVFVNMCLVGAVVMEALVLMFSLREGRRRMDPSPRFRHTKWPPWKQNASLVQVSQFSSE